MVNMDFGIWVIVTTISFAFTVMATKDRIFGIAGVMLMFVLTALTGNANNVVMAAGWDSLGNPLERDYPAQPLFIVLGLAIIACEVVVMFALNDLYGAKDHDESGLLQSAFE